MSDLNTTIIGIFNEWFLKQHGLLPEQTIQRIEVLEAETDNLTDRAVVAEATIKRVKALATKDMNDVVQMRHLVNALEEKGDE